MRRKSLIFLTTLLLLGVLFGAAYAGDPIGDPPLQTVEAKVNSYSCNDPSQTPVWGFIINQIDAPEVNAPKEIRVWYEGIPTFAIVGLTKISGPAAHYEDGDPGHLARHVVKAEADIYVGWAGQFNLSHGPCGPNAVHLLAFGAVSYPVAPVGIGVVLGGIGVAHYRRRRKH